MTSCLPLWTTNPFQRGSTLEETANSFLKEFTPVEKRGKNEKVELSPESVPIFLKNPIQQNSGREAFVFYCYFNSHNDLALPHIHISRQNVFSMVHCVPLYFFLFLH